MMKKLFLSAAAIGLLSGVAVAEPQKLDDQILQDVAAGEIVPMPGLMPSLWASSDVITNTTTNNNVITNTTETRTTNSNLTSSNLNNVYATGVGSTGITANGVVTSTIAPLMP